MHTLVYIHVCLCTDYGCPNVCAYGDTLTDNSILKLPANTANSPFSLSLSCLSSFSFSISSPSLPLSLSLSPHPALYSLFSSLSLSLSLSLSALNNDQQVTPIYFVDGSMLMCVRVCVCELVCMCVSVCVCVCVCACLSLWVTGVKFQCEHIEPVYTARRVLFFFYITCTSHRVDNFQSTSSSSNSFPTEERLCFGQNLKIWSITFSKTAQECYKVQYFIC